MANLTQSSSDRLEGLLEIAPYVLVPGSEARVSKFAALMEDSREVAHRRHFLAYSGMLEDTPISVCSTGCGGASVSLIVDQLVKEGGSTFIRAGVSGGIQPHVQVGDLIIATGVVCMDKTCQQMIFAEYPALADLEVTNALISAAEQLGYPYHAGIVASATTFHAGEGSPGFGGYIQSAGKNIREDLRKAGVYDFDNETAALFVLCSLLGARAGRINVVVDNPEIGTFDPAGEDRLIQTAIQAIRILARWDHEKIDHGKKFILP